MPCAAFIFIRFTTTIRHSSSLIGKKLGKRNLAFLNTTKSFFPNFLQFCAFVRTMQQRSSVLTALYNSPKKIARE